MALGGWIGVAGTLVLASPLFAQQTSGYHWGGDCSTPVRLRNNTDLPLGAVWLAIKDDDVPNPPEIGSITLTDVNGAKVWDVDDDEDGDNDDGGEGNNVDSTPRANLEGWHRIQARTNADILAPGKAYKITLCDEFGATLQYRQVKFFFSIPGVDGGDHGIHVAAGELTIDPAGGNAVQTSVSDGEVPPISDLTFTFVLKNGFATPLDKLTIFARQSDVTVLNVTSSIGGTYDLGARTYTFSSPLPVGASTQMNYTLNQLSNQPPFAMSAGSETEIVFEKFVPLPVPVPALPRWAMPALALLVAGAGALLLRRR